MKISSEAIKLHFERLNAVGKVYNYQIYCIIPPKFITGMFLGAAAVFTTQYFIVNVTEAAWYISGVTLGGEFTNRLMTIPASSINSMKVESVFFGTQKTIRLNFNNNNDSIEFRVSRKVLGIAEQASNVDGILKLVG